MGGQSSKSMMDITNTAVTNVLMKQSNMCKATAGASQFINISELVAGGNIEISNVGQSTQLGFNFNCTSNAKNIADLQNQLRNELNSELQQQMSGLLFFQVQSNEQHQSALNDIVTNVDISSVSSCVSKVIADQALVIKTLKSGGNITIKDIAQKLVLTIVTECLSDNETLTTSANTVDSVIKSKTALTLTGLSFGFAEIALAVSLCVVLPCIVSSALSAVAGLGAGGEGGGIGPGMGMGAGGMGVGGMGVGGMGVGGVGVGMGQLPIYGSYPAQFQALSQMARLMR
ncbi:hypothetical protein HK102_007285 [Quaeritorhiza haematococci]|nr:hypothetical protein HK102_007285 [Quaeritorhiza haematococci]